MNTNVNVNAIQSVLGKGETLEWAAKAEPFKVIDEATKKHIHIRWIIAAVVAAAVIALYTVVINGADGAEFTPVIPIIIIAVAAYTCVVPFTDASIIKRRTIVVTNKRAIIYESDSNHKELPFEYIDEAKFIDKGNGIGDVLLGSPAVKTPYRKIRVLTIMPKEKMKDGDNIVRGVAFFNVAGFAQIKELLPKTVKITECKLSDVI